MQINRQGSGLILAIVVAASAAGCKTMTETPPSAASADYVFKGGFPTAESVRKAYDDADLSRAIQAYKFFYPTVAFSTGFMSLETVSIKTNRSAALLEGNPKQLVYTPNSDTPYALVPLDLKVGPMVVELPPGPLMCVVNDLNQRYVMDLGLPGPDAGRGGKHLILPPGYKGEVPKGYYVGAATTNRVMLILRALPVNGDVRGAVARMKTVKVRPLRPVVGWPQTEWIDISKRDWDSTPVTLETSLKYWEVLHQIIEAEPPFEPYRMNYGELAALGIEKGKPFAPDARLQEILEKAAKLANAQMRVQSFADRRPDRIAWPDRKWEWASLRPENGTFDLPAYKDLEAREKWFYPAMVESPAMFRRSAGAGSLYWLGLRDGAGAFLDGSKTYKLAVPLPVPAKLFWSVTIYDPNTRSEIKTPKGKAALRSLVELQDAADSKSMDLYFGPSAPAGQTIRWIQTIPGKGWFTYFRIYGPERPAFDGSWRPGDFEEVK